MKKQLHQYFIPHEGNDYTPHILQRAAMIAMLFLVLLSFVTANMQALFWMTSDWMVSTILPGVIVDLTNDERNSLAIAPLRRNTTLDEAARLKAEHMAQHEYFSHYSPDGISPWYWFQEVQYQYVHAGENLAIHFSDSGEVVEAWMNSPSHKANIVNNTYQEIGVGTARGIYQGFETVYVVQLFGTQRDTTFPSPTPVSEVVVTQAVESEPVEAVLAQSIDIIETPSVPTPAPEPEPVNEPVTTEPEPLPEPEPLFPESETIVDTPKEELKTPPQEDQLELAIAEVEVTEDVVSLYSETVSTTSLGAPARIAADTEPTRQSSTFGEIATQPSLLLQIIYVMMGAFVAMALLLSILLEIRHQRPLQIAYGLLLLMVMSGLFYIHNSVIEGALIV